jgi:transcription initiation factor TFIIE subunit alpha
MSQNEALAEVAEKIFGEKARKVMVLLLNHVEVSDEEIARELRMDQAELRKLLNDLFEARLVKYRRARDENIGWYKYFWRVTDEPLDVLLNDRKRLALTILEKLLSIEEQSEIYICPSCKARYSLAEAEDQGYVCPNCYEVLEAFDNSKRVRKIREAIQALKSYEPLMSGES